MGQQLGAKCLECGYTFSVRHGGGFFFHLVRCEDCGEEKAIGFDELGELHERYIKGLAGPYSLASREHDQIIQDDPKIKPISESECHQGIEDYAGRCTCGGKYSLDAPPRCPKCHSLLIKEGGDGMINVTVHYD